MFCTEGSVDYNSVHIFTLHTAQWMSRECSVIGLLGWTTEGWSGSPRNLRMRKAKAIFSGVLCHVSLWREGVTRATMRLCVITNSGGSHIGWRMLIRLECWYIYLYCRRWWQWIGEAKREIGSLMLTYVIMKYTMNAERMRAALYAHSTTFRTLCEHAPSVVSNFYYMSVVH